MYNFAIVDRYIMAQKLIQTQIQKQVQVQRLSQQQMLQVRLLEMPLTELEQSVNGELDDNPALETENYDLSPDGIDTESRQTDDAFGDDYETRREQEDRASALDEALENIGRDDDMPQTYIPKVSDSGTYDTIVYGDTISFYDQLKLQMGEMELTEQEHTIMEYLIGSLDDDGLLRKSLDTLSDELAVSLYIDVPVSAIERVLHKLQTFDPPGIGARSLQECLLLQVERKPDSFYTRSMKEIFTHHFDAFIKKHWDKIAANMSLTDTQVSVLQEEIKRLNPKPGAALGETVGRSLQQITPDFIVETDDDGKVSFTLNHGRVPELKVSDSFIQMVDAYKQNKTGMNRSAKEALLYAKEKVEKAQGFIEAIKQRRQTLSLTMQAIIDWQRTFFVDGDEADLRPMILKDIADKTGLDISTISRVSNIKYAQTRWGTFPLRFFFSDGYTTDDGEELSTRKMKVALREIIDKEDKRKPLSDDLLKDKMAEKGFPIARRTIAKYREQLGIPVARLRKE